MFDNPLTAGLPPIHPGGFLREITLPALGKSKVEIAALLGVSRQTLYDILNEKQPVTVPMALRIGKLCGDDGAIWRRMQSAYDFKLARQQMGDEIAKIPTLEATAA